MMSHSRVHRPVKRAEELLARPHQIPTARERERERERAWDLAVWVWKVWGFRSSAWADKLWVNISRACLTEEMNGSRSGPTVEPR